MLVFDTILEHVKRKLERSPKVIWIEDKVTEEDIGAVEKAGKDTSFDPLGLRRNLYEKAKAGKACLSSKRLVNQKGILLARVVVCSDHEPVVDWNLWASIFQVFGQCKRGFWKVVFFPAIEKRRLPPPGKPLGPEHVNGGYAFPGDPSSIVLYREEEAERVLVHELLHACGSDSLFDNIPEMERQTESWAEVFLCAILAKGSVKKGRALWKLQSSWILSQEHVLKEVYNIRGPADYAWRYLGGRRKFLETFGFQFSGPLIDLQGSSRFTNPSLF